MTGIHCIVVVALLAESACVRRHGKAPPQTASPHRIYNLRLTPVVEGSTVLHFEAPVDSDPDTFALFRNGIRHQKDFHYTVIIETGVIKIVPSHPWNPNELITLDYSLKN